MKSQSKIYAVIDTNVIVSSLFTSNVTSNPSLIVESIFQNKIIPLFNDTILNEYRDVLYRTKFHFSALLIENLLETITKLGINVKNTVDSGNDFPDADDVVFYEVKMAVDDSYLVTGNTRHFPIDPLVVTPAQMVDILRQKGLLDYSFDD